MDVKDIYGFVSDIREACDKHWKLIEDGNAPAMVADGYFQIEQIIDMIEDMTYEDTYITNSHDLSFRDGRLYHNDHEIPHYQFYVDEDTVTIALLPNDCYKEMIGYFWMFKDDIRPMYPERQWDDRTFRFIHSQKDILEKADFVDAVYDGDMTVYAVNMDEERHPHFTSVYTIERKEFEDNDESASDCWAWTIALASFISKKYDLWLVIQNFNKKLWNVDGGADCEYEF